MEQISCAIMLLTS